MAGSSVTFTYTRQTTLPEHTRTATGHWSPVPLCPQHRAVQHNCTTPIWFILYFEVRSTPYDEISRNSIVKQQLSPSDRHAKSNNSLPVITPPPPNTHRYVAVQRYTWKNVRKTRHVDMSSFVTETRKEL